MCGYSEAKTYRTEVFDKMFQDMKTVCTDSRIPKIDLFDLFIRII